MFKTLISLNSTFVGQNFAAIFGSILGLEILMAIPAQGITFTKIVDGSTPVPGSSSSFVIFESPAIRGNRTIFIGYQLDGVKGLFTGPNTGAALQRLLDTNTSVPGGTGNFTPNQVNISGFAPSNCEGPKLGQQYVAFVGRDAADRSGIYTVPAIGGIVRKVANFNSLIPGGIVGSQTKFTAFCRVSIDTATVTFDDATGVYAARFDGANRHLIANSNTPITPPSPPVTQYLSPFVSGQNVVFVGGTEFGPFGIYTNLVTGGTPPGSGVVNVNTAAPQGGTLGGGFRNPALNGTNLAFGTGLVTNSIYYQSGFPSGPLKLVAGPNTLVPGGLGNFTDLPHGKWAVSGGGVAFLGRSQPNDSIGVYRWCNNKRFKVVAKGDVVDGRVVLDLDLSNQSYSGTQIIFKAVFGTNGNQGVFIAKVPVCVPPS